MPPGALRTPTAFVVSESRSLHVEVWVGNDELARVQYRGLVEDGPLKKLCSHR